jgi:hypothetical protein
MALRVIGVNHWRRSPTGVVLTGKVTGGPARERGQQVNVPLGVHDLPMLRDAIQALEELKKQDPAS